MKSVQGGGRFSIKRIISSFVGPSCVLFSPTMQESNSSCPFLRSRSLKKKPRGQARRINQNRPVDVVQYFLSVHGLAENHLVMGRGGGVNIQK
jgi:hypothetical protein